MCYAEDHPIPIDEALWLMQLDMYGRMICAAFRMKFPEKQMHHSDPTLRMWDIHPALQVHFNLEAYRLADLETRVAINELYDKLEALGYGKTR